MAKMTQAQTTAELERKASLGIKPTDSKNNAQYQAIVNKVQATTNKPVTNTSSNSSSSVNKPSTNTSSSSTSNSNSSNNSSTYYPQALTPAKSTIPSASYGKDSNGYYKQSGASKTYVTSANKQYFPSNYGGTDDWTYNATQTGNIKDSNGQTYGSNNSLYGNNNSTHIIGASGQLDPNDNRMTVDQYGNWVSDQYGQDAKGTYVIKGGDVNNKVYMNESNKQYFASNVGGTGNFMYDANNKTTYDSKTQAMRTDKDYQTLGDVNKFNPNKTQEYVDYGKKYEGMTIEQLQQAKQSASLLERNFINSIDNTMLKDGKFQGVAPIAFTPEAMQENLANYVYNDMRKEGVGSFQGVSTKAINEMLNQSGLGGMLDVNNVNVPYLIEQQIKAQAENSGDTGYLNIDPKVILDEIVANGGLKRGYMYDQNTGKISVDPQYTQLGDTLADKGEAIRWYGNEEQWFNERTRNEQVSGNTAETPLELRARYQPETMTEEMKVDLEQERQIKTQLEQLTLQLQELDNLAGASGSGLVLNSSGVGTGSGATNGLGSGNANTASYGLYGAGGDSTFNAVTGGGKGAVYGTSQNYTNANESLLNALSRRLG